MAIEENVTNSLNAFMTKSIASKRSKVNNNGVYFGTTAAMRTGGVGDLLTSIFVS